MKRWLTPANALATIAVVVAASTSSIVATQAALPGFVKPTVTSAQVRDNSLTGIDVKNGSLSTSDLSAAAKTQLKAMTGPPGAPGAAGPDGNAGPAGTKGAAGPDAARAYSYVTADDTTSFLKPKTGTTTNPKSLSTTCNAKETTLPVPSPLWAYQCSASEQFFPHWAYDCGAMIEYYCNLGDNIGVAGAGATMLTGDWNGVVGFTGDENGSFVTLMGEGNVVVTGTLTLMRRTHGYHSRVMCQPQVRRSNSSDAYTNLGVPSMVSSNEIDGLVHMTVTGATHFSAAQAGDYDYQVACRLVDDYDAGDSLGDWYFVSGNATATTTEM